MKYEFTDAQELAKKHPATFSAPKAEKLSALFAGDLVKVCIGEERFWTQIKQIEGDLITASIDNELQHTHVHGLKCDDIVIFERRHVYQIWDGSENAKA